MADHTVLSDPKPSARNRGFYFVYYDKPTAKGSHCVALVPPALRDLIRKGFVLNEHDLYWDEQLKASVLGLDFEQPPADGPALPADPEAGWSDHDALAATATADPSLLSSLMTTTLPSRSVSPATARKHAAEQRASEQNIDVDLLLLIEQTCAAFNYACKRIGVAEKPRAMEAQKLATTALIPWLKAKGVTLSDEDEKAMTF